MKKTIKEYSEYKKISTQAVYLKIKTGKLTVVEENGIKYIELDENLELKTETNHSVELLQERIKNLEELVKIERLAKEKAEKDKDILNQRLHESNIIQMKTIETLKQLEYKSTEIEKKLIEETTKTWWQKLFKK